MTDTDPTAGHGQAGALDAMLSASRDADLVSDYATIATGFDEDDYKAIIDIAWRHQFNDERLNFKRDIRDLQLHVSRKVLDRFEEQQ
jgi:hypothetical protein